MVRLENCCCCCSVRTGTLILGWLSLIGCAIAIGTYSSQLTQIPKDDPDRGTINGVYTTQIVMNSLLVLAAGLLLYGVFTERSKFLIPYLVSNMLQIIGNILLVIIIFINLPAQYAASACVGIILNIYFYIVVWSHYKDVDEGLERRGGYA